MADLSVKDFSGGLTDFPIGSNSSVFEAAENFTINEYQDLEGRPGTRYDFPQTEPRSRVNNLARIGHMMEQSTGAGAAFTILKQAASKLYYDNGTAQVELVGPGSTEAFPGVDAEDSFASASWNNHTIITHEGAPWQIPVMSFRDSGGVLRLRTLGLPRGDFSATTAVGGSGGNYIYGFVYAYTYTVGSTEYLIRSRPFLKEFTNIGTVTPSTSPSIAIDGLPDIVNGSTEHYDVTAIKIEIYRSTQNGSVLYYVGEVANGAVNNPAGGDPAFTDTASDNSLTAAGVTLYTTGGVLANDRPPKSKYVHGTSDFIYYANGFEVSITSADAEILPNRVWQSKRGNPSHVPSTFFVDIEEPITGISSIKSVPIVFGANSVYRLDGSFNDRAVGGIFPRKISDGVGCVGHLSIVQTLDGLFFAGNDGFYFTNGQTVKPISSSKFKATYKRLISSELNKKRLQGVFDSDEQLVLWCCNDKDRAPVGENNVLYVMDMETFGFTTWTSGYQGGGPYLEIDVNITGTTLTIGSTEGISTGDFILINGDKNIYIESVDSDTALTLSKSFSNATYSCRFFRTTPVGHFYFENFQPSSLLFANNTLWQGDGRGFCLKYDPDVVNDVLVDETLSGTTGSTVIPFKQLGILYRYAGAVLDLGTTSYRKWVNGVVIKARPRADITTTTAIQPFGENDSSKKKQIMKEIIATGFYRWGTPLVSYGDPRLYKRRREVVDVKRRFPANALRCNYKQLHLESGFVNTSKSDVLGLAAVAAGPTTILKTFTISGTWPTVLQNHWLAVEADGYVRNYLIHSRDSDNQITVMDPAEQIAIGSDVKWVVRAYPQNNYINLIEYNFLYEILGPSQAPYTGQSGGNT